MIPKKIEIKTDGNVLQYVRTETKGVNGKALPEPLHIFQYTKSKTKKEELLPLTESQVCDVVGNQKLW